MHHHWLAVVKLANIEFCIHIIYSANLNVARSLVQSLDCMPTDCHTSAWAVMFPVR